MPTFSVIMPVYNVDRYLSHAIQSVLYQTYPDFELIIVDDQSPDNSIAICQSFQDPRIRIVQQQNLGLAGARNTGIHHAKGEYIALLDADDYWAAEKLQLHLQHFLSNPKLGVSYCPSSFINDVGEPMGIKQTPKLHNITVGDIVCRNPIGNGSAPVIRKQVFEDIAFAGNSCGVNRNWYFDENFRQSEDIECWFRIAALTDWQFEGIPQSLTYYRVNDKGLSANVTNQFESWKKAIQKLQTVAPVVFAQWGKLAEAYQLRYLSRRAIRSRDSDLSLKLIMSAIKTDARILCQEPKRTLNTLVCAILLNLLPKKVFSQLEKLAMNILGLLDNRYAI